MENHGVARDHLVASLCQVVLVRCLEHSVFKRLVSYHRASLAALGHAYIHNVDIVGRSRYCLIVGLNLHLVQRRPYLGVADLESERQISLGADLQGVNVHHLDRDEEVDPVEVLGDVTDS